MSSSSNDSQSPPPPPAPPSRKPEGSPPKVRGLFGKQSVPPPPAGKQSLPPPPAGRGPTPLLKAADAPVLPSQPVLGAPDLPATVNTLDDPLEGLFADGAQPQSIDAIEQALSVHDEPTRSVPREELMLTPSLAPSNESHLFEDVEPAPTSVPPETPRPSHSPHRDLVGVVFDPDQSVARHLGEVAIDGDVGSNVPSDALRDLPLPKVPSVPAPMAPNDEVPVRSMRSAMVIISLVLISGGAATLISLGVIGGSPAKLREKVTTSPAATAPVPATVQSKKPFLPAAPTANAEPTGNTEPLPETPPEPAAAAQPEPPPEPTAAVVPVPAPVEIARTTETTAAAVTSGDPIATGDAQLRAGDLDGAFTQYQAALAADARDHHAMEGLARVHLARDQAKEALELADQIVKRRPKRAAYRVLQGQARMALGDRAGARSAFQEALTLEPDNRDAQRLLGQ